MPVNILRFPFSKSSIFKTLAKSTWRWNCITHINLFYCIYTFFYNSHQEYELKTKETTTNIYLWKVNFGLGHPFSRTWTQIILYRSKRVGSLAKHIITGRKIQTTHHFLIQDKGNYSWPVFVNLMSLNHLLFPHFFSIYITGWFNC